jgi:glycosyltransferase involved in cell wall biosynthesis
MMEERLIRYIYSKVAGVFFQSEAQKEWFRGWSIKKSFVLMNPVDEAFIYENESVEKISTIVNVGRLVEQKNQIMLIEVMHDVHESHPEITLEIYGEGPLIGTLNKKIRELGADSYINLMGCTQHLENVYLEKLCIFALCSRFEGMPNALAEAMAASVPCISTDCKTGPRELLGGDRGILIEVDDYKALYDAIILLVENPKLACEYGQKAHDYVIENLTSYQKARESMAGIETVLQKA